MKQKASKSLSLRRKVDLPSDLMKVSHAGDWRKCRYIKLLGSNNFIIAYAEDGFGIFDYKAGVSCGF